MLGRWSRQVRQRARERAFDRSPEQVARRAAHAALVAERGWDVRWSFDALTYAEGDQHIDFDVFVTERQPIVYLPDAEVWDGVTPAWLRGRRDDVVGRIASVSVHAIEEIPALRYPG